MDDATLTLIDLLGAVALLLWGIHMIQSGIQRAYGQSLRRGLGRAFDHRLKAFAAGLGITALLQSSTATGLMVTAFAAEGFVSLVPSLAAMLGANVGTTLAVQLLSFDVARLSPLFILIGVAMFRRQGATRTRDLGRVAIGLGLVLLALGRLLAIVTPYEDIPSLRVLLGAAATAPMIALLIGAALSWAAHSSIAVVLLVMSFAAKGVISFEAALALTIGANVGAAFNPVVEAPSGGDRTGKQVAIGNLLTRLSGAAIVLPLLPWIGPALVNIEPSLARCVADFHSLFNLALALLFLPLLSPFAQLLKHWMPAYFEAPDPSKPIHLDAAAREVAPIALGCAARETLRMADILDEMLQGSRAALQTGDKQQIGETRRLSDHLDRLNTAIQSYLTEIDPESLTEADDQRLASILAFAINLNHAGNVLDRNLLTSAAKQLRRGQALSVEAKASIDSLLDRLAQNLRTASTIFMTGDGRAARVLAAEKTVFRDIEAKAIDAHFQQLRNNKAERIETSTLHLDLVRNLKSVNDRLVAGAAYPVLEDLGELRITRLKPKSATPPQKNDPDRRHQ
jgi:phosphate:Na+ symporter